MIVTLATFAMGTRFELVLAGENEPRLRAAGEEAIAEIELWHRRLNYFAPDSMVRRINTLAPSHPVALDPETFGLLSRCIELHDETGGAFDITIAPLMRQWGFRDTPPPSQGGGQGVGATYGTQFIALDPAALTIRFARPEIEIDLGGIAKGFALDRAASILCDHGLSCALLHGGTSSVIAIGAPPHQDGWGVRMSAAMGEPGLPGVERPIADSDAGKRGACPWHPDDSGIDILLRDQALSISAPHGRTIQNHHETLGHIIDPRTGAPARGAALAAAICKSATDAEGWSTALLVLDERPANLPDEITSILFDQSRGWRMEGAPIGIVRTMI